MALKPFSKAKTTRVTPKKIGTSITDNPSPSLLPIPNINEFTITVARMNQGILNQNLHIASAKPIINKTGNRIATPIIIALIIPFYKYMSDNLR